ncbi:hypothetical protein J6590_059616 [Homalodisca vitripennis]|nr:hypothetical protein J6590_059616 [Homalodisca vitripennis]
MNSSSDLAKRRCDYRLAGLRRTSSRRRLVSPPHFASLMVCGQPHCHSNSKGGFEDLPPLGHPQFAIPLPRTNHVGLPWYTAMGRRQQGGHAKLVIKLK